MKVLILGAKGLLGTQLRKVFPEAVGWDREDFDIGKITNYKLQIANLKPDWIINCAAYNDVDGAESNPDSAFLFNAEAVGNLAEICKALNIPLVHFSSNYVFDGEKGEYREDAAPRPLSVYGQSKSQGEQAAARAEQFYVIRTAVLFGPKPEGLSGKKSFVELMLELSAKTDTIKAVADEINSLTYAPDLAQAAKGLLASKKPYGIYHLANSGEASWYDFAKEIFSIMGKKIKLIPVSASEFLRPASRPKKAVLVNTKLPRLRPWQEALKDFLKQ